MGSDHDSVGLELPPRTRRILACPGVKPPSRGTTSAYAENTYEGSAPWYRLRNYLRVRGEYKPRAWAWAPWPELPPRTRRILKDKLFAWNEFGTTSAYAENTLTGFVTGSAKRNYLRVRGEYAFAVPTAARPRELPPRTRRIRPRIQGRKRPIGTTSAYAENTGSG